MSHHRKLSLEQVASLPFIRPGANVFDCRYAVEIWDARNRVALNKRIAATPNEPHDSPDGLMHYIPTAAALLVELNKGPK